MLHKTPSWSKKKQTSTLAIYGETGRFPLEIRQKELQIRFWLRLINLNHNNPLHKVYRHMAKLSNDGLYTWCNHIRNVLNSAGQGNLWDDHMSNTSHNVIRERLSKFGDTLRAQYKIYWEKEINNITKNPILRTYRIFKSNFCMENYLLCIKNKQHRKALAYSLGTCHYYHRGKMSAMTLSPKKGKK